MNHNITPEKYANKSRNERIFPLKEPGLLAKLIAPVITSGNDYARNITESKYNLLIGAGSSITSGIPSANSLVETWKVEIFKAINEISDDEFQNQFSAFAKWRDEEEKNENSFKNWLNEAILFGRTDSDYGTLFEYLKPSTQARRDYIEQIVSNKEPSPGYIYLASLINEGYFDTILTTNFDDLLESALRNYYALRPITCAFDSEISSINLKSPRPKIIKLHGDYLFDNLKNTDDELLSLDANMERKIIELCKNRGLICIGYSGRDSSVMDPIFENLRRSKKFLDGDIHWCIYRSGKEYDEKTITLDEISMVSPKLAELADRFPRRVNFYKIRGFDEFFHGIFSACNLDLPERLTNPKRNNAASDFLKACNSMKNSVASRILPKDIQTHYDLVLDGFEKDDHSEIYIISKAQKAWTYAKNARNDRQFKEALSLYEQSLEIINPLVTTECDSLENRLLAIARLLGNYVGIANTLIRQKKPPLEAIERALPTLNMLVVDDVLALSLRGNDSEKTAGASVAANSISVIGIHDKSSEDRSSYLDRLEYLVAYLSSTPNGLQKFDDLLNSEENETIISEINRIREGKNENRDKES